MESLCLFSANTLEQISTDVPQSLIIFVICTGGQMQVSCIILSSYFRDCDEKRRKGKRKDMELIKEEGNEQNTLWPRYPEV